LGTGIRQAFRSDLFTDYDILQHFYTSQADLGMLSLTLRLLWLLDTLHFNSSALNQQQIFFEGAVMLVIILSTEAVKICDVDYNSFYSHREDGRQRQDQ
jgi:hypothetical protein